MGNRCAPPKQRSRQRPAPTHALVIGEEEREKRERLMTDDD